MTLKPNNRFQRCPDCTEEKDIVMVEIRGVYDGALYFECSHCGTAWHRFPKDNYLHDVAERWASNIDCVA